MAKKISNENAGKQSPSGKRATAVASLGNLRAKRAERVRRGEEILARVKKRIDEKEASRFTGMFTDTKRITDKTRKKYAEQEIQNYADEHGVNGADLAVDYDLALLFRRAEVVAEPLADAVRTGLLPLTRGILVDLLAGDEDQFEKDIYLLVAELV